MNEAEAVVAEIRRRRAAPDAVGRICPRRTVRTSSPDSSAPWSATGWTFCRQCRHLESSDDRGDDRRGFRQALSPVNVRAGSFLVPQLLPILGSWRQRRPGLVARSSMPLWERFSPMRNEGRGRYAGESISHPCSVSAAIRVTPWRPAVVATDMSEFHQDGRRAPCGARHAGAQGIAPDDIAGVVAFLASDDRAGSPVTIVRVDGGSKLWKSYPIRLVNWFTVEIVAPGLDLPSLTSKVPMTGNSNDLSGSWKTFGHRRSSRPDHLLQCCNAEVDVLDRHNPRRTGSARTDERAIFSSRWPLCR